MSRYTTGRGHNENYQIVYFTCFLGLYLILVQPFFFIGMKEDNTLIIVAFVLCLMIMSFFLGTKYTYHQSDNTPYPTEVKIDTVMVRDTIIKPIPQFTRILKTDTIVTPNDTVYLPIEQKTVIEKIDNDTVKGSIKAVFSGYNAVLDTLQYDLSITSKTVYKRKKLGFTIGVSGGIGYDFNNKVTPFIGLGVTYGLNF